MIGSAHGYVHLPLLFLPHDPVTSVMYVLSLLVCVCVCLCVVFLPLSVGVCQAAVTELRGK